MKSVQIGGGLVGNIIAEDMSRDFDVTVVDLDEKTLEKIKAKNGAVKTAVCSCTDAEKLAGILKEADIVTAGVPGRLGRQMMEAVIKAGKSLCDISFMPEDFEELDGLAKKHNVTVVPDIGVAPGMSNFLVGRGAALLDEVEKAVIYVGGIPEKKIPPFNYQITWSASDVIEEYTRPARYIKDFEPVVIEAMGDLNLEEFPKVGTLETFITDGLRSLVKNVRARNMQERTMRWPGHVEQMRLLRAMGLFDEEKRVLGGNAVSPRDVACDLLFPMWKMDPKAGDRDLTIMRVVVEGYKGRDYVKFTWDLYDRFDEKTWNNSMGRCTGLTCSIFAHAVASGLIKEKGVIAPEKLAASDELYDFVISEQKKRGIDYIESVSAVKNVR
ncbi:saccharopine dehydrogenase family protein [Synergistes jonesii]|uniref:Saccharopine dehydrogenase n=1 Tax=Synergistes jonesii TaxID=2754 RepID=A0A073IU07_9BACT|nr:saccharopine dehydrogenase C-terminal domain-containing protein [Synergistes jonesii]KEJ92956.1 saccharopine dehydrogenase [Synergistes jonesii]MDY2984784.1 saccharopine dehydrogenase C-terminal domain-containing protein [Synergistes jonesii]OFB62160.1 saccharopine dehydrogenase [Synergistes jonesii]OFB64230.1 saccharopine dehydrogenase [Synergistes jonesii]OFB65628.1 saccharopine dehydrogenase [Synergistes jonesii]